MQVEVPLWSVRYRPERWEDFVGQDSAVSTLRSLAESGSCPNFVLAGPHGTGKTRAAEVFVRQLLGDVLASNYMYLNVRNLVSYPTVKAKRTIRDLAKLGRNERTSFDEYMATVYQEAAQSLKLRGESGDPNRSQILHQAILSFASTVTISEEKVKVLVLDEADAFDDNMHQALRRTMEIYSDVCRFILVTTTLAGWSPAVLSRCIVLKFPAIDSAVVAGVVRRIADAESVAIDSSAVVAVARESSGDLRRAVDLLQICASANKSVTEDTVYSCCETRLTRGVREFVSLAVRGAFDESRKRMKQMIAYDGYSGTEILREMERDLLKRPFKASSLTKIMDRLAVIDHRMTEARNPFIQLEALLATIQRVALEEAPSA